MRPRNTYSKTEAAAPTKNESVGSACRSVAARRVATFGLVLTILGTVSHRQPWVPASVALYISAAYWFTSSTSFANPAITVARSLSDTFAGIAPADVPMFVASQLAGAALAAPVARLLFDPD